MCVCIDCQPIIHVVGGRVCVCVCVCVDCQPIIHVVGGGGVCLYKLPANHTCGGRVGGSSKSATQLA